MTPKCVVTIAVLTLLAYTAGGCCASISRCARKGSFDEVCKKVVEEEIDAHCSGKIWGPPGMIIRGDLQGNPPSLQWKLGNDVLTTGLADFRLDDEFVGIEALIFDCLRDDGTWVAASHIVIEGSTQCLNVKRTSGDALDWTWQRKLGGACSGSETTLRKIGETGSGKIPDQLEFEVQKMTDVDSGTSCEALRLRTQLP